MTDLPDLGDLPSDRFGDLVATVLRDGWPGEIDVSPASPDGVVDAVVRTDGNRHLVHVGQDPRVDATVIDDLAALTATRPFDSTTLVTTGEFTDGGREAALEAGFQLVDGPALTAMVEVAGIDPRREETSTSATLARRLAARWPEPLRERSVELATVLDEVADFEHQVTVGSERADVDFTPVGRYDVVSRMRFTETSLLVYVRRGRRLESVVRLTALQREQPPLADVASTLADRVREAVDERSDRRSRGWNDRE